MKFRVILLISLLFTLMACKSDSSFSGKNKAKKLDALPQTPQPPASPAVLDPAAGISEKQLPPSETPSIAPKIIVPVSEITLPVANSTPVVEAEITISVELSAPEVRAGAKTVNAKAVLSRPSISPIIWSLVEQAGVDLGKIDPKTGIYTSPAKVKAKFDIEIVATLKDKPSINGKAKLGVIPAEQLFVACKQGSKTFPIAADVFKLEPETQKLPDFATMEKSDTICLDKFDIAPRPWNDGFPGAPQLKDWFALHTKSNLIITTAGLYTFKIISDDGANVYLDGVKIISNDGIHWPTEAYSDAKTLTARKHELILDWFQGPSLQIALQLYWKKPGSTEFEIVPEEAFSTN